MLTAASPQDTPAVDDDRPILVRLAEDGGWDLIVEIDGRPITIDHCGDWHRVERRRAALAARARRRVDGGRS